jgi:SecD/SecF fusion protein
MLGKGLVKFFFVLLAIVCLMQYIFMLPTRKVERRAERYAEAASQSTPDSMDPSLVFRNARTAFLDSVSNEVVFSIPGIKKYTYEELKRQQLALGLDLKGGMQSVLNVDLKDALIRLSRDSKDPEFLQALDQAEKKLASDNRNFITIFGEEYQRIAPGKKLAAIFQRDPGLKQEINLETSNGTVLNILRNKADETVKLTFDRLKNRIDKFGVIQPNVSLDAARDQITVELPGIENPERARRLLQTTAKLQFWEVYRAGDPAATSPSILNALVDADVVLKRVMGEVDSITAANDSIIRIDTSWTLGTPDTLGNVTDSIPTYDTLFASEDPLANRGPLLRVFTPNFVNQDRTNFSFGSPAILGVGAEKDKEKILAMLNRPEVKSAFPKDLEFRWAAKPVTLTSTTGEDDTNDMYFLHAIKTRRGSLDAPIEGDRIVDARPSSNRNGQTTVTLKMDNAGSKVWADMTTRAAQDNNREIAITLDDEVVSCPSVNGPITGGDTEITGSFTVQEATDLANILQVGKLPARTKIIQESLIGPSLGKENIRKSLWAMAIGFLIVLAFMVYYYGRGGMVAIIALVANLFFIIGALASLGTVLTLPGIAGIVLTMGMAVDANVIIYERIREELRMGKSLATSIAEGFKHSMSAILDGNITTLLIGFVLIYFGLGPIKGFGTVLIVGIVFTLFTALLMSRLIIDWWISKGRPIDFWTKGTRDLFTNFNYDWIALRKKAYIFSGIVILIGLISIFTRGFDLGVDFKGGYSYNINMGNTPVSADQLRNALTTSLGGSLVIKAVDVDNNYNITTSYLIDDLSADAPDKVLAKMLEGLKTLPGGESNTLENLRNPEGSGVHVTSFTKVNPTIADDIRTSAVWATIVGLLVIFLYILLRFNKWQFSLGGTIALAHDVLVTIGLFSLLHGIIPIPLEIDQAFIAAILTLIGYSINDTVIVFDRIREYLGTYSTLTLEEVINKAVNSTLTRTIITSLTVFFTIFVLLIFGGNSIKGFAFAMTVGVVVGTYSSIFIASPILVDFATRKAKAMQNQSKPNQPVGIKTSPAKVK